MDELKLLRDYVATM